MSPKGKVQEQKLDDKDYILWIYNQYVKLMYYTAKKYISDPHLLEDVVQESLSNLIPKIRLLRTLERAQLVNYIVATVRNTSISHLQTATVSSIDDQEYQMQNFMIFNPVSLEDEIIYCDELAKNFNILLLRLDSESRLLLEGKYYLGYDDKKLAQMLGCKPGSVRMKLTRARRKALNLLNEEGKVNEKP